MCPGARHGCSCRSRNGVTTKPSDVLSEISVVALASTLCTSTHPVYMYTIKVKRANVWHEKTFDSARRAANQCREEESAQQGSRLYSPAPHSSFRRLLATHFRRRMERRKQYNLTRRYIQEVEGDDPRPRIRALVLVSYTYRNKQKGIHTSADINTSTYGAPIRVSSAVLP